MIIIREQEKSHIYIRERKQIIQKSKSEDGAVQ